MQLVNMYCTHSTVNAVASHLVSHAASPPPCILGLWGWGNPMNMHAAAALRTLPRKSSYFHLATAGDKRISGVRVAGEYARLVSMW